MKIIDILNIIARGGQPPKKIYYLEETFTYDEQSKDYYDSETYGLFDRYEIPPMLNDEVKILEITIKPDLGTVICYKKGETDNAGYVGVVDKVNEDGSVCLKQNDKIGKLNIALFDDDDLTTNNKLKHLAFRVNEIIEVLDER